MEFCLEIDGEKYLQSLYERRLLFQKDHRHKKLFDHLCVLISGNLMYLEVLKGEIMSTKVCGDSLLGLRVRIPLRPWMPVSCECCVL